MDRNQHWFSILWDAGRPSWRCGFESHPQRGIFQVVQKFGVWLLSILWHYTRDQTNMKTFFLITDRPNLTQTQTGSFSYGFRDIYIEATSTSTLIIYIYLHDQYSYLVMCHNRLIDLSTYRLTHVTSTLIMYYRINAHIWWCATINGLIDLPTYRLTHVSPTVVIYYMLIFGDVPVTVL